MPPNYRADRADWQVASRGDRALDFLTSVFILNSIKGFGPVKFRMTFEDGVSPGRAWRNPSVIPLSGKQGETIRRQIADLTDEEREISHARAERQLSLASKHHVSILSYGNENYPDLLLRSNNPVPVLYARGNLALLSARNYVACVGARKIRAPYEDLHAQFAKLASAQGFTIVAGFALGADTIGHSTALQSGGTTISVMPNGLERPFPPENKNLWREMMRSSRALAVSEFPLGMRASAISLRKRNKLIVALSQGVMISQTSRSGGSLNAYRAALQQKKPIATFEADNPELEDVAGNQMIADSARGNVTVFRHRDRNLGAYRRWLSELSSST